MSQMSDKEFKAFLEEAISELNDKQETLINNEGLGNYARWWFNQHAESLLFFDEQDELRMEADVVHIGSFSHRSNTWLWSWANVSILPNLREKAEKLQGLKAITGFDLFGEANSFEVDESTAWELTAISVKHLQARGCYRTPSCDGNHYSFLAIMDARSVQ